MDPTRLLFPILFQFHFIIILFVNTLCMAALKSIFFVGRLYASDIEKAVDSIRNVLKGMNIALPVTQLETPPEEYGTNGKSYTWIE